MLQHPGPRPPSYPRTGEAMNVPSTCDFDRCGGRAERTKPGEFSSVPRRDPLGAAIPLRHRGDSGTRGRVSRVARGPEAAGRAASRDAVRRAGMRRAVGNPHLDCLAGISLHLHGTESKLDCGRRVPNGPGLSRLGASSRRSRPMGRNTGGASPSLGAGPRSGCTLAQLPMSLGSEPLVRVTN